MAGLKRVLLFGATGTIGRAAAQALVDAGYETHCVVRPNTDRHGEHKALNAPSQVKLIHADATDQAALRQALVDRQGSPMRFDAVLSCMASRTGLPADAWAVDHRANLKVLEISQEMGIGHFVLLSAICVQKPKLEFQRAKLAFEEALTRSGLTYSIVRPTAFFKSLAGQIERVQAGKPFLVFGNGTLTACKPISDADLADYLVGCLRDPSRHNAILPIGGPGSALTPLDQGNALFDAVGKSARFNHVPVALLSAIIAVLSLAGRWVPRLQAKAELAKIGRYYATESMLVWSESERAYSADDTPSHGADRLAEFYRGVAQGEITFERGDHAVF